LEEEIHLFIIWEKARRKTDELFNDIGKNFEIRDVYEIKWSSNNFARNLKKFYGVTLPDPYRKIEQCGTGPFLLVIVIDKKSKHDIRRTSLGKQLVNTNIYDAKRRYRKLLGGSFPIHGSIHEKETNHDITLLLEKNLEEVSNELPSSWDGQIKKRDLELIGIDGWRDLKQLFFVLNNTVNYVVLRNFEELPGKLLDPKHDDVDILTDDQWQIPYILGKNLPDEKNPEYPFVKIDEKFIKFDVKYVGDTYLDEKWARDILKRKTLTKDFVYVPSDEDYFYTLLHHIIVQKTKLTVDYKERLEKLAGKLKIENFQLDSSKTNNLKSYLDIFMKKNDYRYTYTLGYKIGHNEFLRLINVAMKVFKSEGMKELFRASRGKLQRTISK